MRSIQNVFFAGTVFLLASCDEAAPVAFAETAVNYAVSIDLAARTAGISLEGAPSFAQTPRPARSSGVVQMAIVREADYDPDSRVYRAANVQELIAFTAQHPMAIANRNGICATGTRIPAADGRSVFPVVSRRNGQAYGGLWSNCHWRLVVSKRYLTA